MLCGAVERLALVVLIVGLGLAFPSASRFMSSVDPASRASNDAGVYRAMVHRIAAGDGYYRVVGDGLRAGGYATVGVFNWRTPVLFSTLAIVPRPVARLALWVLLASVVMATARVVPWPTAIAAVSLQVGVALFGALPEPALYFGEVWCGALIGLSVCAFALDRRWLGVALGLAALVVRELAAPYCLVMLGIAVWERRGREAVAVVVAGLFYLALYTWHVAAYLAERLPGDVAHVDSWVQFGGVPFLQATIMRMGWVLLLPSAFAAVTLGLVVAGVTSRMAPVHVRAAAGVYCATFLVIGQPFNEYWGAVAAPVWVLAAAFGVAEVANSGARLSPYRDESGGL